MRSTRRFRLASLATTVAAAACPAPAAALIENFSPAPSLPSMGSTTLNGQARTLTAQMPNWGVAELALLSGWNVTVQGRTGAGASPVFKIYCPGPGNCGSHPPGYVAGGATLAANSLIYNSTGASWTGGIGTAPTHTCNSGCSIDSAAPVKVATASTLLGLGTWTTSGYGTSSLSLSLPTTTRAPLQPGEVYRADVIWTLSTGP